MTYRTTLRALAGAATVVAAVTGAVPSHAATVGSLTVTGDDVEAATCTGSGLGYRVTALATSDDGGGLDYVGILHLDAEQTVVDHDVLAIPVGGQLDTVSDADFDERIEVEHRKLTIRLVDLPAPVADADADTLATVVTALQAPTRASLVVDLGQHLPACAALPYGVPGDDASSALLCDPAASSPFADSAPSSPHTANVGCAADLGLVVGGPAGLPASQYGPTLTTSRAQLASLVVNLVEAFGVSLPTNPPDAFTDDDTSVHEASIDRLAAAGIIGGNGELGPSFFPSRPASRSEMASFMHRVHDAISFESLPLTGPDAFTDDDADPAQSSINGLANAGIVSGKAPGFFEPGSTVTREQIASFFVRLIASVLDAPLN